MQIYSQFKHLVYVILAIFFIQSQSIAHICQYSTYTNLISNPKIEILKQWSTVNDLSSESVNIVAHWSEEDLLLINLLIQQFPFSSTPLTIDKFEAYGGQLSEIYDSQLKKTYYLASFWPGENHYGIIVAKSLTQDGVVRLSIIANINDDDLNCNYYDEL